MGWNLIMDEIYLPIDFLDANWLQNVASIDMNDLFGAGDWVISVDNLAWPLRGRSQRLRMAKKYDYAKNEVRIYEEHTTRNLKPVERLEPEELDEIKEAFHLFDVDDSGFIDFKELTFALQSLGVHHRTSRIERILDTILPDNVERGLSTDHFVELVAELNFGSNVERDEVREAYKLLGTAEDAEGNPKISLRKLREATLELGEPINDRKLQQMIDEAEKKAQADFDDEELLKVIKKTSLYYNPVKDR